MLKIYLNPDKKIVAEIRKKLKENDNYCPCRIIKNENTKCMCSDFVNQNYSGMCHCGLYIKEEE